MEFQNKTDSFQDSRVPNFLENIFSMTKHILSVYEQKKPYKWRE